MVNCWWITWPAEVVVINQFRAASRLRRKYGVRPADQLTLTQVTDQPTDFPLRPSVRPFQEISRYFLQNAWAKCLKFGMLMYPDHLQNGLDFGHSLLIFSFGHYFELKKRVNFSLCGHFMENAWKKWPEIRHADVSWPTSELIRFFCSLILAQFGPVCLQLLSWQWFEGMTMIIEWCLRPKIEIMFS